MFKKILVANRGEIALRIMRSCKEMGIGTASVYSDADKKAAHRLFSDTSFYIGESVPSSSYLNIDKIIEIAKKSGVEAIHPGYGFLAENPDFAKRCEDEKIIFIGPTSEVIMNLGNKPLARKIMAENGIPVIPGVNEIGQETTELLKIANEIGYPVIIKAAAGGGGKGMRIVTSENELQKAYETASREAMSAFGDPQIYIEKYLQNIRHIEIQILADKHGNIIWFPERECSIQRRHQKIIEETPSAVCTKELGKKMGEAAVAAAKLAGYINAGTVEFLYDNKGNFYFLEINTRLQVEHPITEAIVGIDIVREQIEIAAGGYISFHQDEISVRGHAIECRIYAEDPENNFMPSSGKISYMEAPSGPGVRNDCGVYPCFTVPIDYDPILSKLIVHAKTREIAIERMINALSEYVISGVKTSIPFLIDILASEEFKAGNTHTDFIKIFFADWKPEKKDADAAALAFIADELCTTHKKKINISKEKNNPTPWKTLGNWRL